MLLAVIVLDLIILIILGCRS